MNVNETCAPRTKCVFCRATLPASFVEEELVLCQDCIDEHSEDDYISRVYGNPRNTILDDFEEEY